ncbi:MAG: rRNA maturation RNase YbeY [Gammaproteobacteria bacterium]
MSIHVDVQRALPQAEPTDQQLEAWVVAALQGRRDAAELTVRIVDRDESAALNQTYRHKAGPTNVLSFPFELPPGLDQDTVADLLGDLVICAPVVAAQAGEQHKSPEAHWAHMVVHGTLHLLGYDHLEPQQAEAMEGLEISILNQLGFANPYAEERQEQ